MKVHMLLRTPAALPSSDLLRKLVIDRSRDELCDFRREYKTVQNYQLVRLLVRCTREQAKAFCDACSNVGRMCSFMDRDRYQAERERHFASTMITVGHGALPQFGGPGPSAGYTMMTPVGSSGASIVSFRPNEPASAQVPMRRPMPLLFDPVQLSQPHPALLPGLISAFFEFVAPSLPIISYEAVVSSFLFSRLPPSLANAMAALAAPHAGTVPELVGVDLAAVTLAYYEQTKRLLGAPDVASKEHLQSLVLAAQAESQSGRIDASKTFLRRATIVAALLGLSTDATIDSLSETQEEISCLTSLQAVLQTGAQT